jgi:hypothetical protein
MWLKWHDIDYSMTAQFCATPSVGPKRRLEMSAIPPRSAKLTNRVQRTDEQADLLVAAQPKKARR